MTGRPPARRSPPWLCLAGLALSAPAAGGQDSVFDLSLESLMELQVSVASPFESNIATTAASISVLRPADWERRAARSVEEALEQIPSVAVYSSLNSARMVAVRGYANEISVRGMAILLDGIPLNNFSYATSAYDLPYLSPDLLGGIQMIRGPGSTLYGSDAFHGVLALTTRRDGETGSRVRVQGGSYGDASVSLRQVDEFDGGSVRLGAALTRHGDRDLAYGYHDPATGAPATSERQYRENDKAGFVHLDLGNREASSGLLQLKLYADEYRSEDFPGVGVQFYPPLRRKMVLQSLSLAADRDTGSQESSFGLLGLKYERLLDNDLALTLDLWRWQAEQTWAFDFSAYPTTFPTTDSGVLPCRTSLSQANALPVFCPHTIYQFTRDSRTGVSVKLTNEDRRIRTQWAIGVGRDTLAVGKADVRRIGVNGQVYVDIDTPFGNVGRSIDYLTFQARSLLNDRLSAVYGWRLDQYSDVGTATSPRLGLVYQGGEHWSGKLLYNEAFRAPSAAERYGSGPGSQQMANPEIRPETIRTLELILQHYRMAQDSELTLFHSQWVDGIVLNPVNQTVSQYQNTGGNEAWGVELSHSFRRAGWLYSGNLSHTRSRNTNSGDDYSAFPQNILNLGAGREWDGGLNLWLNLRGQLDRTTTDHLAQLPVVSAPDYWRADLHLEHRQGRQRLWLDVRNLLDRRNIVPSLFNAEGGNPDEGVNARLGGEWNW